MTVPYTQSQQVSHSGHFTSLGVSSTLCLPYLPRCGLSCLLLWTRYSASSQVLSGENWPMCSCIFVVMSSHEHICHVYGRRWVQVLPSLPPWTDLDLGVCKGPGADCIPDMFSQNSGRQTNVWWYQDVLLKLPRPAVMDSLVGCCPLTWSVLTSIIGLVLLCRRWLKAYTSVLMLPNGTGNNLTVLIYLEK